MRVLLVTGSFPPMKCGVGDYTASLAEALSELPGTQVAVLTTAVDGMTKARGQFELIPLVPSWEWNALRPVLEAIRDWHPDIVHIQYPTQGYGDNWLPWLLPVFLRLMRLTQVHTWHEFLPMVNHRASCFIAIVCDGLIVVRPGYREKMPSFYRWVTHKVPFEYIPNAPVLPPVILSSQERSDIRAQFGCNSDRMMAFFGFIYPHKGLDDLFAIANPDLHRLVIIGNLNEDDPYHRSILRRIQEGPWKGKARMTGFLPSEQAARLLAAADAVVLPFRQGGGMWNTSLQGALLQGSFVLTTSQEHRGYDQVRNMYCARPGDIEEMKQALATYIGCRLPHVDPTRYGTWETIAKSHEIMYRTVLNR